MSLIGKSIGNYQIKAKLGEGGMGAVYLGEHPLIGKRVAVKVLLEELAAKEDIVSRFFNEAKAVNDIGHQNIVDIVDFGKAKNDAGGDLVYFIMEFLDGESLAARLRRTGLSRDEAMHVMAQCCSALTASHQKGIVHRDLKPENIYLCSRGGDKNFVKILDFGIAKLTGDGGTSSHKTRTGLVIGTPAYMSPEQCEGKGLIDHRSDVYSLGIVMYELLTGRVPFPGEGFGEILVAHLTKQPDPPSVINPDVPPAIEAIVMRAIEKDRNRRFQSMEEFARAVSDPMTHQSSYHPLPAYATGATPTVEGTRGPTTGVGQRPTTLSGAASEAVGAPPRSKVPLVAALAGLLVIGGGAALLMSRKEPKPETAPVPVPAVVQPHKPAKVKVTVTSDPPGAQVFRGDTGKFEDGRTPLTFTVQRGEPATFDIRVKLDGYRPGLKTINTDEDVAVLVPLDKDAPAPVAVAPTTPPPSSPDKPTADKPKKDHHHSSTPAADGTKDKKKGKDEGGGDDMKLLQPKF